LEVPKTYSFYKIFGGFGLLLAVNAFLGFLTFAVVRDLMDSGGLLQLLQVDFWLTSPKRKAVFFGLGMQVAALLFFCSQNKFIVVTPQQITFINPLLPFLRTTRQWSDYDYYVTVLEAARGGPHEAAWLIKNGRIKNRISNFYYSNYSSLEQRLGCRFAGKLDIGPFRQLLCLLGLKLS